MSETIRISLPTYDALTDTNLDHFALFADQDNVLIKEFARGTINVAGSGSGTVAHNLGYIPFAFALVKESFTSPTFDLFTWLTGSIFSNNYSFDMDATNIYFHNPGGSTARDFKYYIFYDNQ
jgi:hypothetical protein